jgi:acyl carrier protein
MLPVNFVVLDSLPITSSGKVDRRALPPPKSSRPEFDQAFVAPRTPVEIVVARIWSEILEVDPVGVDDRFLDLGGDSLLSSSILSRVNRIFSLDLTPRVLLQADTVAKLSEIMNSTESDRERTDRIARTWLTIGSPSIESIDTGKEKDNAG